MKQPNLSDLKSKAGPGRLNRICGVCQSKYRNLMDEALREGYGPTQIHTYIREYDAAVTLSMLQYHFARKHHEKANH